MGLHTKEIPMICSLCGNPFLGDRQQERRKGMGFKVSCSLKCSRALRQRVFWRHHIATKQAEGKPS